MSSIDGLLAWRARCKAKPECWEQYLENGRRHKKKRRTENPAPDRERMWKKYGIDITYEEYQRLVLERGGKCDICGNVPRGRHNGGVLHVDHDHATGKVRGLLCSQCNTRLGHYENYPDWYSRATRYLAGVKESDAVA